jgi:anti-sigma factor RsiW
VRVPAQLEAELLTIPDSVPYRRWAGSERLLRQVAAAAFLVALTAVAVVWLHRPSETDAAIHRVALLTMSEHFDRTELTVKTTDPRELERSLASVLPFPVVLPELGEGLELVGGRRCSLGSHAVAYSLWRSSDEVYSLYQFIPAEFGLTGAIERTTVPGSGASCQVVVWTEGGWGFALVGSHERREPRH